MYTRYGVKAKDISELDLDSFFGEAIFIDLSDSKPRQAITPTYLQKEGVSNGDIVLVGNSPHEGDDKPWLSKESVEWLAKIKIKMIGFDRTVEVESQHTPRSLEKYYTHQFMLSNDIPIIEVLANMDQLNKKRFFFMGIPAKMGGLDSFPIRAVAIEST
jgi:kynurenine formamidase